MKLVRWMMAAGVAAGMAFFVCSCDKSDNSAEKTLKEAGKEIDAGMDKAKKELDSL